MKILEINKYYYHKGGADKHFLDVCALLEKAGHEVAVFSMHSRHNGETYWKKYFLSEVGYAAEHSFWQKMRGIGRMFYSFEAKRKINRLLDEFRPDVVHIHNIYHQLSPAILFEIKKRNIPVVMTVHDYKLVNPNYNLFLNGRFYDRCREGRFYECFRDRCIRNSRVRSFIAIAEMYWHEKKGTYRKNVDLFIAPSRFVKKILVERGIEAGKVAIVPHFIAEPDTQAKPVNLPGGRPYALYAGRISEEKGVAKLIRVFQGLEGLDLYLAGNPEHGFAIPEQENVRYLGFLSPKELRSYFAGASVIVSGSQLPETFGLVALEAIAEGKIFIGFQAGAYPEVIQDGKNGFLVKDEAEFADRLVWSMNNRLLFDPGKIKADAHVIFGPQKYLSAMEGIFERLSLTK